MSRRVKRTIMSAAEFVNPARRFSHISMTYAVAEAAGAEGLAGS